MEIDPASLDPEERTNKFLALFSAALGVMSLCAALFPGCGGSMAILGIILGYFGMKSDYHYAGLIGVLVSVLGLIISLVYAVFLFIVGPVSQ